MFIAQQRILPKPTRKTNKLRLKQLISCTLDDKVYPAEIVGKRTRVNGKCNM